MRLSHSFLKLPKQFCAETIGAEVAALGPSAWVPHPGNFAGNDALLLVTPNGAMTNGFIGPMAPTEHLRKCPYIMEIMEDIGAVWGRSRLMGLAPGATVPPHVDVHYHWRTHLRLHIPVVTNPDVLFTCGDDSVHMGPGECWAFDSFQMHNVRNGGSDKRIHLVLDTVGGEQLWDLIDKADPFGKGNVRVEMTAPGRPGPRQLAFEQANFPEIMSPWEMLCHIEFIARHAPPGPALDAILKRLDRFTSGWAAAWGQFGTADAGLPTYRRMIEAGQRDMQDLGAGNLLLRNQVPIDRALRELIFSVALPQSSSSGSAAAGGAAR